MRPINIRLLKVVLIALVFLASCGDDKEKISLFVGDYVITEASVAESFTVPVTGLGNIPVPVGIPITSAIQTVLLSAASCSSADKTYIELREDFTLFLSCENANPLSAGTWSEVSATELLMNFNGTAIPSSPTGISLQVTDLVKDGSRFIGKTRIPLPKALVAAIVKAISPTLTLDPSAPDVIVVVFALKFTQK